MFALIGLVAHLAGIEMGSPEELDADPEMRRAMTASSGAWGDAFAASGADPDAVASAVSAATVFYVPAGP